MSEVLRDFTGVCAVLAAAEVIGWLCPKNSMLSFVRGLAVLVVVLSTAAPIFKIDWSVSAANGKFEYEQNELSVYIEEETARAAQSELVEYLTGLLGAAGMSAEKIEVETDIDGDGCIVLTKARLVFEYDSDCERARVLLKNTLDGTVELEVKTDGR